MVRMTYVCWDCRRASRLVPYLLEGDPRCAGCRGPLERLSDKVEIPPRDDERAWSELHRSRRAYEEAREDRVAPLRIGRIHELERRIEELRERPGNPDRARLIQEVEQQIARLRAL